MKIVNKNEGRKIPYEIVSKAVCFDDDLTINLAKREQDWPVHIDICTDADGELCIGAAAGRAYVAELDIPAREYVEIDAPAETRNDAMNMPAGKMQQPVPFDIDRCTLSLWAVEEV